MYSWLGDALTEVQDGNRIHAVTANKSHCKQKTFLKQRSSHPGTCMCSHAL